MNLHVRRGSSSCSTQASIVVVVVVYNIFVGIVFLPVFSKLHSATDNARPLAGHLKPLGWHRPAEPDVDTVEKVPEPGDFFEKYVKKGRPLLMKGAAKDMDAYKLWTDEYLRTQYGHLEVEVEEGKKENRTKALWSMRLDEFVDEYRRQDVYMVASVTPELADEVGLLHCLLCGGFTDNLQDAVVWFSSGGTKSVLHFDAVDNINCVLDGQKEIFLVDKQEEDSIFLDHPSGSFSGVDVDKVDMNQYPGLGQVPWYNVTMEPGDCFFIPYRWFHQVRSLEGRNLAINIWFVHLQRFNWSDCGSKDDLPQYKPLGQFQLASVMEQMRGEIANYVGKLSGEFLGMRDLRDMAIYFDISKEEAVKMFKLLDQDTNQHVSLDEVYACDMSDIKSEIPGLIRMNDEDSDDTHDEL